MIWDAANLDPPAGQGLVHPLTKPFPARLELRSDDLFSPLKVLKNFGARTKKNAFELGGRLLARAVVRKCASFYDALIRGRRRTAMRSSPLFIAGTTWPRGQITPRRGVEAHHWRAPAGRRLFRRWSIPPVAASHWLTPSRVAGEAGVELNIQFRDDGRFRSFCSDKFSEGMMTT